MGCQIRPFRLVAGGGEGTLACSGGAVHPFASHKGTLDKGRFSGQSDFREKRFEFVTDSQDIRIDGVGFDIMGHVCDVQAEGVGGGVSSEAMVSCELHV